MELTSPDAILLWQLWFGCSWTDVFSYVFLGRYKNSKFKYSAP